MSLPPLKALFKNFPPILLSLLTSLIAIAVAWGVQVTRLEALEKEHKQVREQLGSHEKSDQLENMATKVENQLADIERTLNRIEARASRR